MKIFERAATGFLFLLGCCIVVPLLQRQLFADSRQVTASPEQLQAVQSFSELRADSPERRRIAEFFDRGGFDLSRQPHGTYRIQSEPQGPTPPPPLGMPRPIQPPVTLQQRYQSLTCRSDAVLNASVLSEKVFLNKSETWLVTEYTLKVSHALKGAVQGTAVLSVDGGRVLVDGRLLTTVSGPLLERDATYILFLNQVPDTNAFTITTGPIRVDMTTETIDGVSETIGQRSFREMVEAWAKTCGGVQ